MSQERLKYLFEKCLNQTVTDEERKELLELIALAENESEANELILNSYKASKPLSEPSSVTTESMMEAIFFAGNAVKTDTETRAFRSPEKLAPVKRIRKYWVAAASVILVVALGWLWIDQKSDSGLTRIINHPSDIMPGKEGAILTLADGTQIVLDSLNGEFIQTGTADISISNSQVAYNPKNGTAVETQWHTLSTPKGRQYSLQLPDGSKVWLNAASSIRFPTVFNSSERLVEITGEVYFEINPVRRSEYQKSAGSNAAYSGSGEKVPFIVKTKHQAVEVLGTHFNVNAYSDEDAERTTLLEGSVRISAAVNISNNLILKPGQQVAVATSGEKPLSAPKTVNTDDVIAWKNGYFNMKSMGLAALARQISRWYDIEVELMGDISEKKFGGSISREVSLNDLLGAMEDYGIRWERKEGKLILRSSN